MAFVNISIYETDMLKIQDWLSENIGFGNYRNHGIIWDDDNIFLDRDCCICYEFFKDEDAAFFTLVWK